MEFAQLSIICKANPIEQGALTTTPELLSCMLEQLDFLEKRDGETTLVLDQLGQQLNERDFQVSEGLRIIEGLRDKIDRSNLKIVQSQRDYQQLSINHQETVAMVDSQGNEILKLQRQHIVDQESIRQLTVKVMKGEGRAIQQEVETQLTILQRLPALSRTLPEEHQIAIQEQIRVHEIQRAGLTTLIDLNDMPADELSQLQNRGSEAKSSIGATKELITRLISLMTTQLHRDAEPVLNQVRTQLEKLNLLKKLILKAVPVENHVIILSVRELADLDEDIILLENFENHLQNIRNSTQIPLEELTTTQDTINRTQDSFSRIARHISRLRARTSKDFKNIANTLITAVKQKLDELADLQVESWQTVFTEELKAEVTRLLHESRQKIQEAQELKNTRPLTVEQIRELKLKAFGLKEQLAIIEQKQVQIRHLEANIRIEIPIMYKDINYKFNYLLNFRSFLNFIDTKYKDDSDLEYLRNLKTPIERLTIIIDTLISPQNAVQATLAQLLIEFQKITQCSSEVATFLSQGKEIASLVFTRLKNAFNQKLLQTNLSAASSNRFQAIIDALPTCFDTLSINDLSGIQNKIEFLNFNVK